MFIPFYLSPCYLLARAESEDLPGLKQTGAGLGCERLAPVINKLVHELLPHHRNDTVYEQRRVRNHCVGWLPATTISTINKPGGFTSPRIDNAFQVPGKIDYFTERLGWL
jgi:hypothetical protein